MNAKVFQTHEFAIFFLLKNVKQLFPVERVVDEEVEFSSSSTQLRTYTYPKGNGTKKSHSLPDSALLPLCCLTTSDGGPHPHRYNSPPTSTQQTKETSVTWILKKQRLISKSDGDSPSVDLHYPSICGDDHGQAGGL